MPSLGKRKKKQEARSSDATAVMATGGRYIVKVQDSHRSTSRYPAKGSTVVRNPTTKRKSEAGKNNRSLSVPSLTSVDVNGTTRQSSPPQQSRSNSVRLSNAATKKFSFKKRIAKIFGSHSDLSGKCSVISDELSSGVYRPIGEFRTRSTGGSSDCSSSSLTSAPQHSELSRHNSLRDSSRSRVSQSSVFSSRQASYDSADALNYTVHGTIVPSESGLRPRSIACMQHSSSSNSLKNNALHAVIDLKYHSIAAMPPRVENNVFLDSHMHILDSRGRGAFVRGNPSDDLESPLEESEKVKIKPSDPEYKKVAKNLMSCLPPHQTDDYHHYSDASRKTSNEGSVEDYIGTYMYTPPSPMRTSSIDEGPINLKYRSGPAGAISTSTSSYLPRGWEAATTSNGLKYYLDHSTQSTHWKLPNDSDDALSLPNGWELVKSNEYGTYYVNHNNKTAQYQHPIYSRPPPAYHSEEDEGFRRVPLRSHSHRSSQAHRIVDGNASLPRRSKSFRNEDTIPPESTLQAEDILHTRQLSTMTYVPPSPFQIAEIPGWLKDYVGTPFGSNKHIDWPRYSTSELTGLDTMIKRLLKKDSEQLVKKFEYYRVGIQQEIDERQKLETLRRTPHAQDVHNYHSSHSHSPRPHKHTHSPNTTRQAPPPTRTHNGILLPRQQQQHNYVMPSYHPNPSSPSNHRYRRDMHATTQPQPHVSPSNIGIYSSYTNNLPIVPPEMLQGLEEAFV